MGDGSAEETGEDTIDDRIHYQSREFCKGVRCTVQAELDRLTSLKKTGTVYDSIKTLCRSNCRYAREDFRQWLESHGYRFEPHVEEVIGSATKRKMTAYEFHQLLIDNGIDIVK